MRFRDPGVIIVVALFAAIVITSVGGTLAVMWGTARVPDACTKSYNVCVQAKKTDCNEMLMSCLKER